jgi:signal peptidase I
MNPITSSAAAKHPLWRFLCPALTRRFLIRTSAVALAAYLFFGHLCLPLWIRGGSMEPAWRDGGFVFLWRPRFVFREPEVGDVVALRMVGTRVMLLKRVVALAGDTVAFRAGTLYVNDALRHEPYVRSGCDWELSPRRVDDGCVYVVGDNRGMHQDLHRFGQVERHRIVGAPLW